MMKKILLSLFLLAALVACNNTGAVNNNAAEEAYTKNVATAQAFLAAFSAKDSVKMASLAADNFIWVSSRSWNGFHPQRQMVCSHERIYEHLQ